MSGMVARVVLGPLGDAFITEEITRHDPRAGDMIGTAIAMTGWDDNGPEYGEHVAQLLAKGGWALVKLDDATSGRISENEEGF